VKPETRREGKTDRHGNLMHRTVNLNGTGNPEKGVFFSPKYRKLHTKCSGPHKIPMYKKAISIRLQHRSTNKIAIRKKINGQRTN